MDGEEDSSEGENHLSQQQGQKLIRRNGRVSGNPSIQGLHRSSRQPIVNSQPRDFVGVRGIHKRKEVNIRVWRLYEFYIPSP